MTDPCEERPIDPQVKDDMNLIAQFLDATFNGSPHPEDRKFGFALLVFKTGEPDPDSRMNYICNCDRKDMIKAMKEFIARNPATP